MDNYRGMKFVRLGKIVKPKKISEEDMKQLINDAEATLIYCLSDHLIHNNLSLSFLLIFTQLDILSLTVPKFKVILQENNLLSLKPVPDLLSRLHDAAAVGAFRQLLHQRIQLINRNQQRQRYLICILAVQS